MYARTSFAILVAVLCAGARAADPLPRAKAESVGMNSKRLGLIATALKADVDKGRLPGAVVAVARKGKLVYYEAVGYRDKAANAPMTKDTIFSIASMTKPMTSVALLMLSEEGKLLISDPVGKYLPPLASRPCMTSCATRRGCSTVGAATRRCTSCIPRPRVPAAQR